MRGRRRGQQNKEAVRCGSLLSAQSYFGKDFTRPRWRRARLRGIKPRGSRDAAARTYGDTFSVCTSKRRVCQEHRCCLQRRAVCACPITVSWPALRSLHAGGMGIRRRGHQAQHAHQRRDGTNERQQNSQVETPSGNSKTSKNSDIKTCKLSLLGRGEGRTGGVREEGRGSGWNRVDGWRVAWGLNN